MLTIVAALMLAQATAPNAASPQPTPTPSARIGGRTGERLSRQRSRSAPALGRTERSTAAPSTGLPTQPFVDADRSLPTPR